MLKDDKSYPFIKITNERYPRPIITRQVKRMAVFISVPTQMGAATRSSGFWIDFSHSASVPILLPRSAFTPHLGNAWLTQFATRMRLISRHGAGGFLISRGRMPSMSSSSAEYRRRMEFERVSTRSDPGHWDPRLNSESHGHDLELGCLYNMWTRADVCRSVRASWSSAMSISSPYYTIQTRAFLDLCGAVFYQEKSHLRSLMKSWSLKIDEAVKALVMPRCPAPARRSWSIWPLRMRVSSGLQSPWKSMKRPCWKILEKLLQISTPVRISLTTPNIMGDQSGFSHGRSLSREAKKRDYRARPRPSSGQCSGARKRTKDCCA